MSNATATLESVRKHAELLLKTIGVSRIIVVDDEYALHVEGVLGICAVLDPAQRVELPHLHEINFEAEREIWVNDVRDLWVKLDEIQRRELVERAHACRDIAEPVGGGERDDTEDVDTRAATSLDEILGSLDQCRFLALALGQWKERADELLADDKSANHCVSL